MSVISQYSKMRDYEQLNKALLHLDRAACLNESTQTQQNRQNRQTQQNRQNSQGGQFGGFFNELKSCWYQKSEKKTTKKTSKQTSQKEDTESEERRHQSRPKGVQHLDIPTILEESVAGNGSKYYKLKTNYDHIIQLRIEPDGAFKGNVHDLVSVTFVPPKDVFEGYYKSEAFHNFIEQNFSGHGFHELRTLMKYREDYRRIGQTLIVYIFRFLLQIKFLKSTDMILLFAKPLTNRDHLTISLEDQAKWISDAGIFALVKYYRSLGFKQFQKTQLMYASIQDILDVQVDTQKAYSKTPDDMTGQPEQPPVTVDSHVDKEQLFLHMKAHVTQRFQMLHDLLKYYSDIRQQDIEVEIDLKMGSEIAGAQWNSLNAQFEHQEYYTYLKQQMKKLQENAPKFATVVLKKGALAPGSKSHPDWVDFAGVSPTKVRVWGANYMNHDRKDGYDYRGGANQAAGIHYHLHNKPHAGLFSVITTPFQGTPLPLPQTYPFWWPSTLKSI